MRLGQLLVRVLLRWMLRWVDRDLTAANGWCRGNGLLDVLYCGYWWCSERGAGYGRSNRWSGRDATTWLAIYRANRLDSPPSMLKLIVKLLNLHLHATQGREGDDVLRR